jgi:hypothetical protein
VPTMAAEARASETTLAFKGSTPLLLVPTDRRGGARVPKSGTPFCKQM